MRPLCVEERSEKKKRPERELCVCVRERGRENESEKNRENVSGKREGETGTINGKHTERT